MCVFEDGTNVFWVNLQLIKVVQQGFLSGATFSVSRQARDEFLLGVAHRLCLTLRKSLNSLCQKIIRRIEGKNMFCKTKDTVEWEWLVLLDEESFGELFYINNLEWYPCYMKEIWASNSGSPGPHLNNRNTHISVIDINNRYTVIK